MRLQISILPKRTTDGRTSNRSRINRAMIEDSWMEQTQPSLDAEERNFKDGVFAFVLASVTR